jgi:hypothetical protein
VTFFVFNVGDRPPLIQVNCAYCGALAVEVGDPDKKIPAHYESDEHRYMEAIRLNYKACVTFSQRAV